MNTGETILDIEIHKTEIEQLTNSYLISNTPSFLYDRLRGSGFVNYLAGRFTIAELENEFVNRGEAGIDFVEELVIEYALYVAITFKEFKLAKEFFETKGNINFEWFPDIKSIFLSSYIPTNISNINLSAKVKMIGFKIIHDTETSKEKENIQELIIP